MKSLTIFILLFINVGIGFGQDYSCPKEVNFGDFIVIDSLVNSKSKIQYFVSFKACKKNNSEIFYYGDKLNILYDSLVYAKGNYLSKFPPQIYKDSIVFQFTFQPKYIDYISEQGKYLEADYTFYYRKKGHYNLDSQTVRLKYRLIRENTIFINKLYNNNSYYLSKKSNFGNYTDSSSYFSLFVNNTDKNFIIDSVKQKTFGSNFFSFGFGNKDTFNFPRLIKAHTKEYFTHKYKLLKIGNSTSIIEFFGHFENNHKIINFNDTINILFDFIYGIYVSHDTYFCEYINDTSYIKNIVIKNYTDSIYFLKNIEIKDYDNLGATFINTDTINFPYMFTPWSGKWFNKIMFIPRQIKKYKLLLKFNFICKDNSELSRELEFIITAIDTPITSIKYDDKSFNKTTKAISPNPATDYIDVMLSEAKESVHSVKIYDILGICVLTHPLAPSREGERIRLDVSGLAAGVYFVSVGGRMYKFVKM
jgi:hypothetical protein